MKLLVIKLQNLMKIALFIFLIAFLLIFSKDNFSNVQNTTLLFINNVFASLFPFIFFTEIILTTDIIYILSEYLGNIFNKIFRISKISTIVILIGFLCGFPMGAKTVAKLYSLKLISKKEAEFLLKFTNNCNPAFIISTIGIGIFQNITIGLILLISHYISAIIIGIISSFSNDTNIIQENVENSNKIYKIYNNKSDNLSFFNKITQSLKNSFITLSYIFGFIIIFNLLFNFIQFILIKLNLPIDYVHSISAIFEVTNGCAKIFKTNFNILTKIYLVSFALGFSGFCIIFQIYSNIFMYKFSLIKLIIYKFLQGIISMITTYILIKYTSILKLTTIPIYSNTDNFLTYEIFMKNISISYISSIIIILLAILITYLLHKKSSLK